MCLVQAWNTGLEANARAPELSHQIVGGEERLMWSSLSNIRIQNISAVAREREWYFALVFDLEATCYFLADQEIKFGPRKIPNPVVDLLSSGLPAQSESQ
jgi:hypothetical protein